MNRPENKSSSHSGITKRSSALTAGAFSVSGLALARTAHAQGDDTIRIGLVGCGGRGSGAASNALRADEGIRVVAMADAFPDKVESSWRNLTATFGDRIDVPEERRFSGFDAYQHVLSQDIDLVILATSPGFRPLHYAAAVEAGKHVFMEKPVAVDASGIRTVLETNEKAKAKGLAVAVGHHYRHEPRYRETIARLHDGAIGEIILSRAYYCTGGVWTRRRVEGQTELEYQMRNWYYFKWLCGDQIVEQHVHNLDIVNWVKQALPVSARGQGGRQVRTSNEHGQIFDHHAVEYTYADGSKFYSQCRHQPGAWVAVGENVHGTDGTAEVAGATIRNAAGEVTWSLGRGGQGGHQLEWDDLMRALRAGEQPFEADYGATSTMTAILGRMATYSGKEVRWEDAINSDVAHVDPAQFTAFDNAPPVVPDERGNYPVPIPGVTPPS